MPTAAPTSFDEAFTAVADPLTLIMLALSLITREQVPGAPGDAMEEVHDRKCS